MDDLLLRALAAGARAFADTLDEVPVAARVGSEPVDGKPKMRCPQCERKLDKPRTPGDSPFCYTCRIFVPQDRVEG